MSLRNKTFLIISLVTIICMVIVFVSSNYFLLNSFLNLEEEYCQRDVQRVIAGLEDEINHLSRITTDWSNWDDSYHFIEDSNQEYIQTNLGDEIFETLNINLILFMDTQNIIIYEKTMNNSKDQVISAPPEVYSLLNSEISQQIQENGGQSGVLWLPQNPMIISIQPITTSNLQGPVNGLLIMGHYLDNTLIESLAEKTRLNLKIEPVSPSFLTNNSQELAQSIQTKVLDKKTIEGWAYYKDIQNKSSLKISVKSPRDIYQRWTASIRYFGLSLLAVGIVLFLVVAYGIEQQIIARLGRISTQITNIHENQNLEKRIEIIGGDELSSLSEKINQILLSYEIANKELHQTQKEMDGWAESHNSEMVNINETLAFESGERKRVEQTYKESEERYQSLANQLTEAIILSANHLIIHINPAGQALLRISSSETMVNAPLTVIFDSKHIQKIAQLIEKQNDDEKALPFFEDKMNRMDGSYFDAEIRVGTARFQGQPAIIIIIQDITERKKLETMVKYMATHDSMTDIPNRSWFHDHLNHALARAKRLNQRLAILFIDLDNFKNINDTFSHKVGDMVLQIVAERIKNCLRENDFVARFGGDEFSILLEGIESSKDALTITQTISQAISLPLQMNTNEIFITSSIGISLFPDNGYTSQTLLQNADTAMFYAKNFGKNNNQLYDQKMTPWEFEHSIMVNELHRAILKNEFIIFYQPIVELKTGKITGIEALLRWQHPEKGLLEPSDFMGLAEEAKLIIPIGEWVFQNVCEQLHEWNKAGFNNLRAGINLSVLQFEQPDFVDHIWQIISERQISPGSIELEVTENSIFQKPEKITPIFTELRNLGIRLAIDNFGASYTSLGNLARFPFDTIKIDLSFMKNLPDDPNMVSIIKGMIAFAQNLNMEIVIGGVETEEQIKFFKDQDNLNVQGWFFSEAVYPEKIIRLMQESFEWKVNTLRNK